MLAIRMSEAPPSFLARQYGVPDVDLSQVKPDARVLSLVPRHLALKHLVVPLYRADDYLVVAFADPANISAQDELHLVTDLRIEPVVAPLEEIRKAIAAYYPSAKA